jgi:GntR family transcriptional repressor for pyruvate dehydrogenase complex
MFSKITVSKVYQKVMEQIRDMIEDGTLKKGDRLPSERELADQLGVSRTSIREAVRALEVIGLIESKQGEGNFISEHPEDGLFQSLSLLFMLRSNNLAEILELRKIVDAGTAALAAENIKTEQLEKLRGIIQQFKMKDEKANANLDLEFHYTVAEASANYLVLEIYKAVYTLLDQFITGARKRIIEDPMNQDILLDQHEEIFNAIEAHDPIASEKAMKNHLNFVNSKYPFFGLKQAAAGSPGRPVD